MSADAIVRNIHARFRIIVGRVASDVEDPAAVLAIERQIATVLSGAAPQWGCLLAGNVGNGKTSMMRAVQMLLLDTVIAGIDGAEGMRFVSANALADRCFEPSQWHSLKVEPVLAIDDLGTEPSTVQRYSEVRYPLTELIEYRYANRLLTFATTNLTPQERLEKYGLRIADRMHEMFSNVVFKHQSYR